MRSILLASTLLCPAIAVAQGAPGSDQFAPLPNTTDLATLQVVANANAQASSEYGGKSINIQPGDCVIGQSCSLTDGSGNKWTLVPNAYGNVGMGQVMQNGQPSNQGGDGSWVVALRKLANGQVTWEQAKGAGWFSDTFWGVADPGGSAGGASVSNSSSAADTATPAPASTNTSPGGYAPFAANDCSGLTFSLNNTQGWNYGGTNDGLGNGSDMASTQASNPSSAVSTDGTGISIGVTQALQGAMLNTHGQFSQQYGYFEMQATLTAAGLQPGMTTAFWLMPEKGGWPPEIDIEETSGNTGDTDVHAAPHQSSGASHQYNMQPGTHIWAVDWNKDNITFYIDGEIPTLDNGQPAIIPTPSNFNQPMYMVLDAMSQGPSAPAAMLVQSIKVYKDIQSAVACVPQASPPPVASLQPSTSPPVASNIPAPKLNTSNSGANVPTDFASESLQQQVQTLQSEFNFFLQETGSANPVSVSPADFTAAASPTLQKQHHRGHWHRHRQDTENDNDADDQ